MCLMPYLWFGEINISLFAYFLSDVDLHVLSRSPFFSGVAVADVYAFANFYVW